MSQRIRFAHLGLVAIAATAVSVVGCKHAPDPTGNWTGTITRSSSSDSGTVPLEIRKDNTFVLGQSDTAASGTWKLASGVLSLTITKVGKTEIASLVGAEKRNAESALKPIGLTMSPDAKTLSGSLTLPGNPTLAVSFAKNER